MRGRSCEGLLVGGGQRAGVLPQQPLDVFGEHVHFEVDRVAGLLDAEGGQGEGRRDEADGEVVRARVDHGQADAVDRDGALLDDVAAEVGGERDRDDLPVLGGLALDDGAGAVDVALHQMTAQAPAERHGALQVDAGADGEGAEAGAVQGLGHDVGGEPAVLEVDDGEADAVDGDRVAVLGAFGDDGAADQEAGRVAEVLDGDDLTQFFDDSGEHSALLGDGGVGDGGGGGRFGGGGDAQVGAEPQDIGHRQAQRLRDGGDSRVGEGGGARAEQDGGQVADDLVDGAGGEERPGEGGAALQQDRADPAREQLVEHGGDVQAPPAGGARQPDGVGARQPGGGHVLGDGDQRGGRAVQDPGARGDRGVAVEHDAQRLADALRAARGEVRVVGAQGAGADDDGVRLGAQPVHIGPGGGGGDPAAGAVGGRAAPVEGRGVLPQHEGAAVPYGGQPGLVDRRGLLGEQAALDGGPGGGQGGGPARGPVGGVGDGVDDAGDPGLQQGLGAGAGAAGVVAGLQGDDGGAAAGPLTGVPQGVDLGVRAAGPLVPALARDPAVGVEDHAADDGVGAGVAEAPGGERHGTAHRFGFGCGGHRVLLPLRARTPGLSR
ncbi:phosphoenolpyruvate synthase/pyruvate phosphate dikinase [Streptomyces sparsogenes DSM 40356]|uniref:Phosphoenolpyruvate synthase/pyruvate phosphate dikinase n=1 Tax=Streptomyces sparsogenes DSM 40356 TaxID=1331668 RepID=A0A1R1STB1_9ACTN|nr:phosphoenolpyruvate synthase/pyruvate phosphate dikinase [Streptomyces sparsogenes DSM 40356]